MNISISSEEEYREYLQKYKWTAPEDKGNEISCMYLYLEHLAKDRQIPIHIETDRECPDFIFKINNQTIGLEHTRASCQTLSYAREKLKGYPEGSMLEVPDCWKYEASREGINGIIKRPREPLTGDGFGNFGPEKILIDAIINSIEEKTKKLNQNYEICDSNELIICDNINIPVRLEYVWTELNRQYIKTKQKNFDKVHFVANEQLYYNIISQCS